MHPRPLSRRIMPAYSGSPAIPGLPVAMYGGELWNDRAPRYSAAWCKYCDSFDRLKLDGDEFACTRCLGDSKYRDYMTALLAKGVRLRPNDPIYLPDFLD